MENKHIIMLYQSQKVHYQYVSYLVDTCNLNETQITENAHTFGTQFISD